MEWKSVASSQQRECRDAFDQAELTDTVTLSPSSRVYGSQGQSAGSDPNLVKFGSLPATDITEVGGS